MPKRINRREFLTTGAGAACGAGLAACQPSASDRRASARKPNILFIITDQQNIDTIAAHRSRFRHPAHGANWVHTPNLDRLARRGVSFVESHSANPVCSPERSCLLTGRMASETGVITNNLGISPRTPNLGQWFSDNSDYQTFYCGKWHLTEYYPSLGSLPGFQVLPLGGTPCGDYNDFAVSAATEAFLREYRQDQPFLFVAAYMNPHDICYWTPPLGGAVLTAGQDYFHLGDRLPVLPPNQDYEFPDPRDQRVREWGALHWRNYAYDYYRMIEKIDNDVGRLLDAVDDRGDDTLVVFTSDHGEGLGRHRRVQKWHPFDESVKVPLVVSCPGRVAEDRIDAEHLVNGVDIMPTLCDVAGIPAPPDCRGRSLLPLLTAATPTEWPESIYMEFQRTGRIVRTPRYKYVKFFRASEESLRPFLGRDGRPAPFDPARLDDFQAEETVFLFDMKDDPWETRNLALESQYSATVAAHEKLLRDDWLLRLRPNDPVVPPNYRP